MILPSGQMVFEMPGDTIADKVLLLLGGGDWITTNDFLANGLYTFRNRISELRRKGYHIVTETMPETRICRYRLESECRKHR